MILKNEEMEEFERKREEAARLFTRLLNLYMEDVFDYKYTESKTEKERIVKKVEMTYKVLTDLKEAFNERKNG